MLDYERFKELVTEKLSERIRQDYPDVEVKQDVVWRDNQFKDTLFFFKTHEGMKVTPTLYLSGLYSSYVRNGDLDYTLHQCYLELCDRMKYTGEVRKALDDGALEGRITFELIHTEQNRELLNTLPHREFQDLSIIYNCSFQTESLVGKARVTHQMAERLGISEENLYAFAYENTRKVHKPIVRPLEDVMLYAMFKQHEEMNLEEVPEKDGPLLVPLYMLTNRENNRGAVSMLYPEELEKLAEKLDSDLYILPASVDMVLVTNTQDYPPETLAQIVYDMNCHELNLEERLSNQIYHYNRQTQMITLATNTEHTMLSDELEQLENSVEVEQEEGMTMGMEMC